MENHSNWGGKREGAGRKSKGDLVFIGIRAERKLAEKITQQAKESGLSKSEYIISILSERLGK